LLREVPAKYILESSAIVLEPGREDAWLATRQQNTAASGATG
jgi:hypothetical protein